MTARAEPLPAGASDTVPPSNFPCGCAVYEDCPDCAPMAWAFGRRVDEPESQRDTWTGDEA